MRIEPDSLPEIPAAINTIANDLSVNVYPVPAQDEINIVCADCDSEQYQLTIFNMLGEEIFANPFSGKAMRVDARNFPTGIYTALLKGNGGSYLRKIIVE